MPELVTTISGPEHQVIMIAGGEHHSIALTREGKVFCWGRNDDGQCGRGDLFGTYKKQKKEEYERMMKEDI